MPTKSGVSDTVIDALFRFVGRIAFLILLVIFSQIIPPHPQGIWYFGDHSRWLIAVEQNGLAIGLASSPLNLGWIPIFAAKALVVGIPFWLFNRIRVRRVRVAK